MDLPSDLDHNLRLVYTDQPDLVNEATIRQKIKDFNDENSPHHRAASQSGRQLLGLFVYDQTSKIVGGLIAYTYWGWLYIDELWLEPRLRGHGHGRCLLHSAESEARRRGCLHAYVRTWDFQARGFYERLGYQVTGKLKDYPPGQTFYWMRKDF